MSPMKLLLLGRGKTGALVAEVAHRRGHQVEALRAADNPLASALTPQRLAQLDIVIDFTTPNAVLANIEACVRAHKNMLVGTTGWHQELPRIRRMVEEAGSGFLYGANFSCGVNLFFDAVRIAAAALRQGYSGQIFERHHAHKKDAPSGTAVQLQGITREVSGSELEITSFREGDVVGMHELVLDSPADTIYLCHDAKSRLGFAEGAVRAAEWLAGRTGFFDFRDIWREL
jgi:4-hydroxy-tetrahydrodipicolinate reductase